MNKTIGDTEFNEALRDRNNINTPNKETAFCNENNIEILWGIGGKHKVNSSSWILQKWSNNS